MATIQHKAPAEGAAIKESLTLSKKLSDSQTFRDYETAFGDASGLPLAIRPIQSFKMVMKEKRNENPFCSIMARKSKSCSACLEVQKRLEKEAQLAPCSLKCFAGLFDSLIPIRIGERVIAFLQTGQVRLDNPDAEQFKRLSEALMERGVEIDLKPLREAFYQSPVLRPEQYEGFLKMLSTFAKHLALVGNSIAVSQTTVEPLLSTKAREYIEKNYERPLALTEAARSVNTSVRYFSKVFKSATGATFVDYLTRFRIEKAKQLLLDPNRRIGEVAFEVGFESLTQFNRSFKKITGTTPTKYRKSPLE